MGTSTILYLYTRKVHLEKQKTNTVVYSVTYICDKYRSVSPNFRQNIYVNSKSYSQDLINLLIINTGLGICSFAYSLFVLTLKIPHFKERS